MPQSASSMVSQTMQPRHQPPPAPPPIGYRRSLTKFEQRLNQSLSGNSCSSASTTGSASGESVNSSVSSCGSANHLNKLPIYRQSRVSTASVTANRNSIFLVDDQASIIIHHHHFDSNAYKAQMSGQKSTSQVRRSIINKSLSPKSKRNQVRFSDNLIRSSRPLPRPKSDYFDSGLNFQTDYEKTPENKLGNMARSVQNLTYCDEDLYKTYDFFSNSRCNPRHSTSTRYIDNLASSSDFISATCSKNLINRSLSSIDSGILVNNTTATTTNNNNNQNTPYSFLGKHIYEISK